MMAQTYAILEVSEAAYKEIEALLRLAHHDHVFDDLKDGHGTVIDMSGIVLAVKPE